MAERNDTPGPLASTKPSQQPGCQLRRFKVGYPRPGQAGALDTDSGAVAEPGGFYH